MTVNNLIKQNKEQYYSKSFTLLCFIPGLLCACMSDCNLLEAKIVSIPPVHSAEHIVTLHKLQIMSNDDGPYFLLPSILLLFSSAQNKCQKGDIINKHCGSSAAQHILNWTLIPKREQKSEHFRNFIWIFYQVTNWFSSWVLSKLVLYFTLLNFVTTWSPGPGLAVVNSLILGNPRKQGFVQESEFCSDYFFFHWISSSFQTWNS